MRRVDVYLNDIKAGLLTENIPGKEYMFQYDRKFLEKGYPAVSLTLPKRSEPYYSETLFPFFSNMLPEGENRKIICSIRHLDENDIFGLLCVMADQDFIGAVNIRNARYD